MRTDTDQADKGGMVKGVGGGRRVEKRRVQSEVEKKKMKGIDEGTEMEEEE